MLLELLVAPNSKKMPNHTIATPEAVKQKKIWKTPSQRQQYDVPTFQLQHALQAMKARVVKEVKAQV